MKRQTLLLILVAVMSLAGAAEAFCQAPQRGRNSRFKSDRKMNVGTLESHGPRRSNAAVEKSIGDVVVITEIPDWLKDLIGPWPPGSPGPTFPEPEPKKMVTDIMVDILLEQQFSPENYNYDRGTEVTLRRKRGNQSEGIFFAGNWIIIVTKDHPLVIVDIDDLLENPAEYEGADGDDTWDVRHGH